MLKITLLLTMSAGFAISPAAAERKSGMEGLFLADDALGVMATVTPVDAVAQCMARVAQTQPVASGAGFTINDASGLPMYRVSPFNDQLQRYTTRVDILRTDQRGRESAACIIPPLA